MNIFFHQYWGVILLFIKILILVLVIVAILLGWKTTKRKANLRESIAIGLLGFLSSTAFFFFAPSVYLEIQSLFGSKDYYRYNQYTILIRGDPSSIQLLEISAAFNGMNSQVISNIKTISFREDNHFGSEADLAHVGCGKGKICVKEKIFLDRSTVQHETAHLHTFKAGGKFLKQWQRTAGNDVYGQKHREPKSGLYVWEDNTDSPRYGCVSPYGATNVYEDVATFYEYLCLLIEYLHRHSNFKGNLGNDIRYKQKIDLLHEYNFLDDSEYQKIKSILNLH